MKARPHTLPPEMERYVRDAVEHQIKLEAGYVTESLVCIAALVLSEEPYNFGKKRLEDYCERIHARVKELTQRYGNDWPDAAMGALKKKGVEILDDGWIAERQWYIDKSKPREPERAIPLTLTGELEKFRRALEDQK